MIRCVLKKYAVPSSAKIESLGNAGGFSGSEIWRVFESGRQYCLRRWPPEFDKNKLGWIHDVIRYAHAHQCVQLTLPLNTVSGSSFVEYADSCWELTSWARGSADFAANPNARRLQSAIETLAAFHRATARFFSKVAPSKNLQDIIKRLETFGKSAEQLEPRLQFDSGYFTEEEWRFFKPAALSIQRALLNELACRKDLQVRGQPVIRDIRAEHLFFDGDKVCAIIDFGAMQIDTVACDLSRMLGSLIGDDEVKLNDGVSQYEEIRPLSNPERELVLPMNRASVLIGLLNWLEWIFVENRRFESEAGVRNRIVQLLDRLNNMR